MSLSKTRKGSTINNIVDYTLPKLHTGKNWYVDFTCFDPADGKMRRKKYMLDSIAKMDQRKNLRVFFFKHTTSSVYIKRMPYLLPL